MRQQRSLALLSGVAASWLSLTAPGSAATLNGTYGITLAGVTVGIAKLVGAFDQQRYRLLLRVQLTGLAGAVTGGKGAATAAGTLVAGRLSPSAFAVTARSSSDERTIQMAIADHRVAGVEIKPPIEEKPDRVPVTEANKRGIIDPLSALLQPVANGGKPLEPGKPLDPEACNRTLPIFDGGARFNITLSYSETKTITKAGYSGPVLVCAVRYKAVAGHRPRPGVKYMEENREISVWLAPVENTQVLLPIRISVMTTLGTAVAEAQSWSVAKTTTGLEASDKPPSTD